MPVVELLYDPDCPNVDGTREHLRRALTEVGLPHQWQEWSRASSESPAYVRDYGSPTVLVDARDVAGASPAEDGNSCRIYSGKDGQLSGIPPVEMITSRLLPTQAASHYLLPLMAAFLGVALFSLGHRARRRRADRVK